MHKKVSSNHRRNVILLIAGGALSVIIAAGLVVWGVGGSNGSANGNVHLQTVTQPASAAQIAKNLNCTRFTDDGPAVVLSNDSGSCYIGSHKYGINTFPNQQARDSWLQSATQLGVVPKWETATSVVYPSVD